MKYDAVVVGGGFYGLSIAEYLLKNKIAKNLLVIERGKEVMLRASKNNQRRIHNGLHYLRSLPTAIRCIENYQKFSNEWKPAVYSSFNSLYGISKINSKVSSRYFEKFANELNIPFENVSSSYSDKFNLRLIDKIYEVDEKVFNTQILRDIILSRFNKLNINFIFNTTAQLLKTSEEENVIILDSGEKISTKLLFNCTYSGINHFLQNIKDNNTLPTIKHELTEISIVKLDQEFTNLSFTLMDGPFFSLLPHPESGYHSLSHVTYTPRISWEDNFSIPYKTTDENFDLISNFNFMKKATEIYTDVLKNSTYVDSYYEIKSVLVENEHNDGRPIVASKINQSNTYNIFGSKIDQIYDVFEFLDSEFNL